MKEIKTISCDAADVSYTILKYQKFGWELDYVQKLNFKYEIQFSKEGL